jgi:hypothetical protein
MQRKIENNNKSENVGVKRCIRCVMPENYPGITFDAEGVCNVCRHFDANWGSFIANAEERQRSEAKHRLLIIY